MSDTIKDQGQASNPGASNENHLTQDGQPDRRFKEHGGGSHGNQGGRESGGFEEVGDGTSRLVTEGTGEEGVHKPSEHGGKKLDGSDDKRTSSEHGFGGNRELASEAGQKGGKVSGQAE